MIRVEDALRKGFAHAHRSFGLILLDVLWKAVWFVATLAAIGLVGMWFGSQLNNIEWRGSDLPGVNGLIVAALLREIWNAYAGPLFWLFTLAVAFSVVLWMFLEAYVRAYLLGNLPFRVFLLSGFATRLAMAGAFLSIGIIAFGRYLSTPVAEWPALWNETRGAAVVAFVSIVCLGVLLKIFETALRSDSVELLGRNMLEFVGLVGTLMLFEAMIDVALLTAIVAALLSVSSSAGVIAVGLLAAITIVISSLLNSYLLLVRFSAVGIMRHDAIDI
jgi:hypothetical protein